MTRNSVFASVPLVWWMAFAATASAVPATAETLSGIAQKANLLVVAEVTAIDKGVPTVAAPWNVPALEKTATLRILRGLTPADSASVELEQVTVRYLARVPSSGPVAAGPSFPKLQVGQVGLFPLKRGGDGWRFISEEDHAMIMPAVARTMNYDAPDARILLFRELAGAFTYGDFETMMRAGRYLDGLGPEKESPVEPVFALIRHEIGESNLREDPRYLQIAVAVYLGVSPEKATFGDLLEGDLPASKGLRLAALSLRKCSRFQLEQRLVMMLVNRQNESALAPVIARALAVNFAQNEALLALEREALKEPTSGVLQVADVLVTSRVHPLAGPALVAAGLALPPVSPDAAATAAGGVPRLDDAGIAAALSLLLRLGGDDYFALVLDQIALAAYDDPAAYRAILRTVGGRDDLPAERVLRICRQYLNDPQPLTDGSTNAEDNALRVCDQAALIVARVARQDFGFRADAPVDAREAAIERMVARLDAR